ncbi:MAG: iron-molybdenum cofactor biosynthesis protein [Bacteroidetes bacterium]|nr:iron-molybdenum cofactor biosynthesis protein [Bacteroidota bacterium]
MKLAIASDDSRTVTGHIGRVRGFLILSIVDGQVISKEYRQNLFTHHSKTNNGAESEKEQSHHNHGQAYGKEHSHGHSKLSEGLKDCSHLICHGAGWRVVEDLKKVGIEVIFTTETDAATAAIKYSKGELEINENGACHAH